MSVEDEDTIIVEMEKERLRLQLVQIPTPIFNQRLGLKLICYTSSNSTASRTFLVPLSDYSELYDTQFYVNVISKNREVDKCTFCEESDPDIRLQNKEAGFVVHTSCLAKFEKFVKGFLIDNSDTIVRYTI